MRKKIVGLLGALVLMAPGCVEHFPLSFGEELALWTGLELVGYTLEHADEIDWEARPEVGERESHEGF